jgi:hypothetical protein
MHLAEKSPDLIEFSMNSSAKKLCFPARKAWDHDSHPKARNFMPR